MRGGFWIAILASTLNLAAAAGPAKTPEQLASNVMESAKQGDADGFTSQLTASSATALRNAIAAQTALEKADVAFRDALDRKFGKGTEIMTDSPGLKQWIARFSSVEVGKTAAGRAELKMMSSGQQGTATLVGRQESGAWKLDLPVAGNAQLASQLKAASRIIKDVGDGKYTDRSSAMLALGAAWNPAGKVAGK
jgi:hypothetical protein